MRRLGVLFAAVVLLRSSAAHAWACADEVAAELESLRVAKAPLNAHLRIRFLARPTPADLAEISLRAANGKAVSFRARELPEYYVPPRVDDGYHPTVLMELIPVRKLQPNTKYEISWRMSKRAKVIWPGPWRSDVLSVGTFTTGSQTDTSPPSMPPVLNSVFVDRGWVLHSYKSDAPGYVAPSRLRAWPQGLVLVDKVRDDLTPDSELYYWAWRVGAERTAFLSTRSTRGVLEIGAGEPPYECETGYQFPFPKASKQFRMAIVAVDLAGNVSQPRYITLDRKRVKRKPPKEFSR
jgi:hypothetical protein